MSVDAFIARWSNLPGGAERANFQGFVYELVEALGLDRPDPAQGGVLGAYQFDGPIANASFRSTNAKGFADLYKRGSFVMEAKQSYLPPKDQRQPEIFDGADVIPLAPSGAAYDKLMIRAQGQAKNYAVNLPADHPSAPFLIVCDIGRAFEIYFDFAGNGRGYGFFPDKQSYRIPLSKLRNADTQALFRDIWNDPRARDPKLKSAEVTRDVSQRLAEVSKALEMSNRFRARTLAATGQESAEVEESALFLMRILFCMFAEDIGLLPENSFKDFLADSVEDDRYFEAGLTELWAAMGQPHRGDRFSMAVRGQVRYFNGGLFENNRVFALTNADKGELLAAARRQWRDVEPAIFGTLLEQALTDSERAKLGAHYTPRAYVERLVEATIMDVLNAEWSDVQDRVTAPEVDADSARHIVHDFHDRLAALRILDPACGTGNFLYVAMEALEQLEAQVIEVRQQLGDPGEARVGPHQFFGLEKNPRAAKIAELVLWIGWLRFRIRNDPDSITDPVLARGANINFGRPGGYDAVLDEETGLVPDWPDADFIVGNPPFIGKGEPQRKALGMIYLEAMWRANPRVPKSADFVMQWWDRAAHTLVAKDTPLRRFGFVTTNSITQEFSRRVIAGYLKREEGSGTPDRPRGDGEGEEASSTSSPRPPSRGPASSLSLVFAIPDHPWIKAARNEPGQRKAKAGGKTSGGPAAVRIAMTVAEAGGHEGRLVEIVREAALDSDAPVLVTKETTSTIGAKLTVGADVTKARKLKSNSKIAVNGVLLAGQGFVLSRKEVLHLQRDGRGANFLKTFKSGAELMGRDQKEMVIDFSGVSAEQAEADAPLLAQHLLQTVYVDRKKAASREDVASDAGTYLKKWWLFAKERQEFRQAKFGTKRFIATTETTKHRVFQFLDEYVVTDHMIVGIALSEDSDLAILSSSVHLQWVYANCGLLGIASFAQGHRYTKTNIFDTFPFPVLDSASTKTLRQLGSRLDTARRQAIGEVDGLSMTEIYNLRADKRTGKAWDTATGDRAMAARVGIIDQLHDQIDAAVAAAYGWPADLPPSEIVARLVALNATRAADERGGQVRWLRPDYQIARFGG